MMRRIVLLLVLAIAGCTATAPAPIAYPEPQGGAATVNAQAAPKDFNAISRNIGAQARSECRRRTSGGNCDFKIVVDPNPRAQVNAYQTLDKEGRPVIIFTQSMIKSARNGDELAFVMGHEAAHHIRGHLARQSANAEAGAVALGGLAVLLGSDAAGIESAQKLGAVVGARSYSKEFELEADQLGTIITYKAGYNPLIGVKFFERIPDPGDRFLGTHPPNAQRVQIVNQTAARLGLVQ